MDDKEIEIYVIKPTNNTVKHADRHKSKTWNQAIQDDVLTKKELGVLMRKRGIWDEAKDKEEEDITKRIVELEKQLYNGDGKRKPKVSEGRDLAVDIRRARLELRDLIAERISLEENTADPVYNSFEEYNNKSADEIAFAAAGALAEMLYNIDSSFEKNLPENQWLTKFGLVDDELNLIDPTSGDKIDTKGRKIDDEGYLLDDDGKRVDRDGNEITSEGLYKMTDYQNDLAPKKRRSTRKAKAEEKEQTETNEEALTTES